MDIHISDHQPVILFPDDDLPKVNVKYISIKTNTDEARKLFKEAFINKRVFEHFDTDIHVADPNPNYKNRLNKTIALAKRMYYKHNFDQFKYDMKKNGLFYQIF